MHHPLAGLDFDALIDRVARATDKQAGRAADWIIQDLLADTAPPDRVGLLRSVITATLVRSVTDPRELVLELPLVEALVRVLHHPRLPGLPTKMKLASGVDALARVLELADQHPELVWDVDRIQVLLVQAVRDAADRAVVDDGRLPWHLVWGEATSSSHVLWTFVTLRALGDLDVEPRP